MGRFRFFVRMENRRLRLSMMRREKSMRVDAVVISTQHSETVGNDELRAGILKHVIQAVIPAQSAG